MAEVILMPRLSDTMTEGVIAAWHKQIGDTVKKGDLLAEIETDKATMELESYNNGTLLHIGAEKGKAIAVNSLLAIIGAPGEDISAHLAQVDAPAAAPAAAASTATAVAPAPTATATAPAIDLIKSEEAILMPRLSDTMTEGVIAAWHKKVGDAVKKGELLAEIETDKATMELESYKTGTLLYIGAQQGEKIAVNDLLCIIGNAATNVEALVAAAKGGPVATTAEAPASTSVSSSISTSPSTPETSTTVVDADGRIKASPLAKKLAAEKGINLNAVHGSGDGGRIVKKDIDSYQPQAANSGAAAATPATSAAPAPVVSGEEGFSDTPNSQMRKVIARRLGESMYSAPHFYLTMEINMDNAMAARAAMNEVSPVKISFNDMLIKACATALRQHPAVNSSWMGDFIRHYHHIHIGSAVAVPEGLIVPVIRFADQKSLSQIAGEAKELYDKAKNKKLQPNEFSGNTFTISNLGMMDIEEFTAIINPPDSCILAVGRIKEIVVKKGDGFGTTNVMKVTLSCDHRSVDGAVGAAFLQTLKKYMENPVTMLV
jgi:pyruvate dehydrogenase E2 component (dihydrolipoamide acetyltransferase)